MLKAQGSIEYLLMLGAVLVIASIVVTILVSYSSAGPETLQKQCQDAIKQSIAYKASMFLKDTDVEEVKSICMPCYKLDKYYINKNGISTDVSDSDILKNFISFVDYTTIKVGNNKEIKVINYPYFFLCLTTTSSGISKKTLLMANARNSSSGLKIIGKIVLNSSNNYTLNGYQVRIDLSSIVSKNGYNLSFYDDNLNVLSYCFEQPNGECNQTPSNIIWLKTITLSPGENDIYIFENPTRAGLTDGRGVFDFYEDFKTLDTSIWGTWTDNASSGFPKVENGILYLSKYINSKFNSKIYLKNKILKSKYHELFIKYQIGGSGGEDDFWIHYPDNYNLLTLELFEDEYWRWIRVTSYKPGSHSSYIYWVPGGTALRDNWQAVSITRIDDNKFILKYYKPWNTLYKTYEYTYAFNDVDLSELDNSGLSIGTCCGASNPPRRNIMIDFIRLREIAPKPVKISIYSV